MSVALPEARAEIRSPFADATDSLIAKVQKSLLLLQTPCACLTPITWHFVCLGRIYTATKMTHTEMFECIYKAFKA